MDFGDMVPVVLFICTVWAIKVVVDARVRKRMVENNVSEDLVKSMLLADERSRQLSALKWGLVLTLVGVAFVLGGQLHLDDRSAMGILTCAAGIGMLIYHFIANRMR